MAPRVATGSLDFRRFQVNIADEGVDRGGDSVPGVQYHRAGGKQDALLLCMPNSVPAGLVGAWASLNKHC